MYSSEYSGCVNTRPPLDELQFQLILQELNAGSRPCINENCASQMMCIRYENSDTCICTSCNMFSFCAFCLIPIENIENLTLIHRPCCRLYVSENHNKEDCHDDHLHEVNHIFQKSLLRLLLLRNISPQNSLHIYNTVQNFMFNELNDLKLLYSVQNALSSIEYMNQSKKEENVFLESLKVQRENPITYLLLGVTGVGKSLSCSFLTNSLNEFHHSDDLTSDTKTLYSLEYDFEFSKEFLNQHNNAIASSPNHSFICIDCPGFLDTRGINIDEALLKLSYKAPNGIDVIILTLDGKRMTDQELSSINILERIFGVDIWDRVVILFTHSTNDLVCEKICDLDDSNPIKIIAKKCNYRIWKTENHRWLFTKLHNHHSQYNNNNNTTCDSASSVEDYLLRQNLYLYSHPSIQNKNTYHNIVKIPHEYEGIEKCPENWIQQSDFDRQVIHCMILRAMKSNLLPFHFKAIETLKTARIEIGKEYNTLLRRYEEEMNILNRKYYSGLLTREEHQNQTSKLSISINEYRSKLSMIEYEKHKNIMETRSQLLRWSGKGLIAAVSFATVAYTATTAATAIAAISPGIAAAGIGTYFWRLFTTKKPSNDINNDTIMDSTNILKSFIFSTLNSSAKSYFIGKVKDTTYDMCRYVGDKVSLKKIEKNIENTNDCNENNNDENDVINKKDKKNSAKDNKNGENKLNPVNQYEVIN